MHMTFSTLHTLLLHAQTLAAPPGGNPNPVPTPTADTTGTADAILKIAAWGAGLMGSFLVIALVWQGGQYMMTHDLNRNVQLKAAAIGIIGGALIAVLAVTIGPELYKLMIGTA